MLNDKFKLSDEDAEYLADLIKLTGDSRAEDLQHRLREFALQDKNPRVQPDHKDCCS